MSTPMLQLCLHPCCSHVCTHAAAVSTPMLCSHAAAMSAPMLQLCLHPCCVVMLQPCLHPCCSCVYTHAAAMSAPMLQLCLHPCCVAMPQLQCVSCILTTRAKEKTDLVSAAEYSKKPAVVTVIEAEQQTICLNSRWYSSQTVPILVKWNWQEDVLICASNVSLPSALPLTMLCWLSMAGMLLAELCSRIQLDALPVKTYVVFSLVILLSVPTVYWAMESLGLDPLWTFPLAKKWCAKPEWIHWDTSLFFALTRNASSLLGEKVYTETSASWHKSDGQEKFAFDSAARN